MQQGYVGVTDGGAARVAGQEPRPADHEIEAILAAAVQAPSIHNTQPWRFEVRRGQGAAGGGATLIVLHADRERSLPVVDRSLRALHISCGAALLNLQVALSAHGYATTVSLLPALDDDDTLAVVRVGGSARATEREMRLYAAIAARHTSRLPYRSRVVPARARERLAAAARTDGCSLRFLDRDEAAAVLAMSRAAEGRQRGDEAYLREIREWSHEAASRSASAARADGVPRAALGAWSALESVPLRDFTGGLPVARPAGRFESEPLLGLLSTPSDGPADWLRAGMGLQRLWLTLTDAGLVACPMTQALEMPELRDLLVQRRPLSVPQVVLRIGYGPAGAPSPRRPVAEVASGLSTPPGSVTTNRAPRPGPSL